MSGGAGDPSRGPPAFRYLEGFLDPAAQAALVAQIRRIATEAPFFQPVMPRSGQPFSVRMTNAGPLGWLSDKSGYRYSPLHPVTGRPWPAIPDSLLDLWCDLTGLCVPPECCLVNFYKGAKARMGLHQDRDEETFAAPVVSLSLGDSALFRIGGPERRGRTRSFTLRSGDIVVLAGESRRFFHGIDRIMPGSSDLLEGGGRLNITLRRVSRF